MSIWLIAAVCVTQVYAESVVQGFMPPEASAVAPSIPSESPESQNKRKKVLDAVRNGVVMVEVKSYGSVDDADESAWAGSGFLVNKEKGIIATNRHVAGKNAICTYRIKFSDGSLHKARLLYADPLLDFAFLEVEPQDLPSGACALEMSTSPAKVNDTIYAMGNSAQEEFSTYEGTVCSVLENVGPFPEQSFKFAGLTTHGASGSPVFSQDGKVVGILYGGKFVSGVALPVCYLSKALEPLLKEGQPKRRSIGLIPEYANIIQMSEIGQLPQAAVTEYLKAFPQSQQKILAVHTRLVGTPCQSVLEAGDILWKVQGELIGPDIIKLDDKINSLGKDEELKLQVYRGGKVVEVGCLSYSLNEGCSNRLIQFAGTTWFEGDELLRYKIGREIRSSKGGVYVMSASRVSPLAKMWRSTWFGNSRPMQITHVNERPIQTLSDLEAVIHGVQGKKTFSVRYIDWLGQRTFGDDISADRQERFFIASYDAKFDKPRAFQWNEKTLEWDISEVKGAPSGGVGG